MATCQVYRTWQFIRCSSNLPSYQTEDNSFLTFDSWTTISVPSYKNCTNNIPGYFSQDYLPTSVDSLFSSIPTSSKTQLAVQSYVSFLLRFTSYYGDISLSKIPTYRQIPPPDTFKLTKIFFQSVFSVSFTSYYSGVLLTTNSLLLKFLEY